MKLEELKQKCASLGIIPQPTRHRINPDRFEVCSDDCIRAIQQFSLDKKKVSQNVPFDTNLESLIKIKSPMLARLIKHQPKNIQKEIWDDKNPDWKFEKKYDGIRCFISYNKDTRRLSIYSRSLDDETLLPKEYTNKFAFINEHHFDFSYSFLLDSEFIIDGYGHEVLEDILNDPYKDMEQFKYSFVIFDILYINNNHINTDLPLWKRWSNLKAQFLYLWRYSLPFDMAESKPDTMTKEEYYNFLISKGGEGVIAKNLNSSYDIEGKRNGDWTKIKRLRYEGTSNLNEDTYDLFVSDYIVVDNVISGLELSSYLVDNDNNYIYDRFNNQIPITLGILYDLLPDTKKTLTLYSIDGTPYINPRFLDMVVEVRSTGFDDSTNQLQNLKFVCWRLDKNSRDCKYKKKE